MELPPGVEFVEEEQKTLPPGVEFVPENGHPPETLPPGVTPWSVANDVSLNIRDRLTASPPAYPPGVELLTGEDDGSNDKIDNSSFFDSLGAFRGMMQQAGMGFIGSGEGPKENHFHEEAKKFTQVSEALEPFRAGPLPPALAVPYNALQAGIDKVFPSVASSRVSLVEGMSDQITAGVFQLGTAPFLPKTAGEDIRDLADYVDKMNALDEKKIIPGFLTSDLPYSLGSMGVTAAASVAGQAVGIPAWLTAGYMGSSMGAKQGWEDAKRYGADDGQAAIAWFAGSLLGATEAFPTMRVLDRLDKSLGGMILDPLRKQAGGLISSLISKTGQWSTRSARMGGELVIREGIKGFLEEGIQNAFQQMGQDFTAAEIAGYDPDRDWLGGNEGKAMGEGGAMGFLLSAAATALGIPLRRRQLAESDVALRMARAQMRLDAGGEFTPLMEGYLDLQNQNLAERKALGDTDFVDKSAEAAFGDAQKIYDFMASTDPETSDIVQGLMSGVPVTQRGAYTPHSYERKYDRPDGLLLPTYQEVEDVDSTVGDHLDVTPVVVAEPKYSVKLKNRITLLEKQIDSIPNDAPEEQLILRDKLRTQKDGTLRKLGLVENFYRDTKNKIAELRERFGMQDWKILILDPNRKGISGSASFVDRKKKIYALAINSMELEDLSPGDVIQTSLHEFGHLLVYNRVQNLVREAMGEARVNTINELEAQAKSAFDSKDFDIYRDRKGKVETLKKELQELGHVPILGKGRSTEKQDQARKLFSEWIQWVKDTRKLPFGQAMRTRFSAPYVRQAEDNLLSQQTTDSPNYWYNLHEWMAEHFVRFSQQEPGYLPPKSNPLYPFYKDMVDLYKQGNFQAPKNFTTFLNNLTTQGKIRNKIQEMIDRGAKTIDDVLAGHVPEMNDLVDRKALAEERDTYNRFLNTFLSWVNLEKENSTVQPLQNFNLGMKMAQRYQSKKLAAADMRLKAMRALGRSMMKNMADAFFFEVMDGRPFWPQPPPLTESPYHIAELREPIAFLAQHMASKFQKDAGWTSIYDPADPALASFTYKGRATISFEKVGKDTQPYYFIKVSTPEGMIPNSFQSVQQAESFVTSTVDGLQRLQKFNLSPEALSVMRGIKDDFLATLNEMEQLAIDNATSAIIDEKQLAGTLAVISKDFEDLRARPYFPLMRFGRFTTSVFANEKMVYEGRSYSQGQAIESYAYDNRFERAKHFRELEKRFKGMNVKVGRSARTETHVVTQTMPSTFMRGLADKLNLSKEQKRAMNEEIANTFPYHTFKKHFIRRKNVTGFSEDITRSYAAYMRLSSSHLMRAKFYDNLAGTVIEMEKTADRIMKQGGDSTKRRAMASSMASHLKYVMDPAFEWQALRSFIFNWHFAANLKSAAVNATQIINVTFPYLAARYGDGDAAIAIRDAYRGVVSYWRNPAKAPQEIQELMATGKEQGWIDESLAMEIALARSSGQLDRALAIQSKRAWYNITEVLAKPFHLIEKSNRMVTALAAYHLARDSGITHHGAIGAAEAAVDDTQFIYSKYARPNFLKGRGGSAFMFMNYMANMLYYMLGQNPGAMRTFIITLMLAGGLGLPFMDDLEEMASWLLTWLKKKTGAKDPYTDISKDLRDMLEDTIYNPDLVLHGLSSRSMGLGVSAEWMGLPFPNVDISQSLSMGNIIPGTGILKTLSTGSLNDAIAQAAEEGTGVLGGTVASLMKGLFSDDPDTWKRIESMLPTAARSISKAVRLAQRGGEFTRAGDVIARFDMSDPQDVMELMMTALSFQPSKLNKGWERELAVKDEIGFYETWKRSLMRDYDQSRYTRSSEGVADAKEAVRRYNKQAPNAQLKLSGDDLLRSFRSYHHARKLAERGIEGRKTYRGLARDAAEPFLEDEEEQ